MGAPEPDVHPDDARTLGTIKAASVDVVLTSPPYAATYDYLEHHDVRLRWLRLEDVTRNIAYEGAEHVAQAMADGQGVILVGLHQGNWDFGGAVLAQQYPVHIVVDTHKPPRFNTFIQGLRERTGVRVIPVEQAARGLLGVLGRNEVVGVAIDAKPGIENGVEVTFLGRPLRVPAGVAALALRTGARLVPVTLVREEGGRYRGFAAEAIRFTPSGDRQQDLRALMQGVVTVLEQWVRRADVLIDNFTPETAKRLRLSWERLSLLNERLVHVEELTVGLPA